METAVANRKWRHPSVYSMVMCRKQALRGAAASGQLQPLAAEGLQDGLAAPIDEAEIRSEAMVVGLIAADRLASLLLHNAEVGPRPGLKVR